MCKSHWGSLYRLADRLRGAVPGQVAWRVDIVAGPTVNAFAAPDGTIIVFEGLLADMETPDEMAGVLAHEIGHVMKDHPTVGFIRRLGFRVVLGGMFSGFGEDYVMDAADIYALSYDRDAEREADQVALSILDAAAVDTEGMARLFERIGKEGPGGGATRYLSTHPTPQERVAANPLGPAHRCVPAGLDRAAMDGFKRCLRLIRTFARGRGSSAVPFPARVGAGLAAATATNFPAPGQLTRRDR